MPGRCNSNSPRRVLNYSRRRTSGYCRYPFMPSPVSLPSRLSQTPSLLDSLLPCYHQPWYRQADGQVESLACLVLEVSSVSGQTTYFQLHTECPSTCRSFSILPSLPSLLPTILLIKASDPGRYWYLNTCTTGFGKKRQWRDNGRMGGHVPEGQP